MSQTLLCLGFLVAGLWAVLVIICFLRDLCWGSTRERLQNEIQKMEHLTLNTCVGSVVLYHNWPHLVVETEDQGLRLVAFRPPYSEK